MFSATSYIVAHTEAQNDDTNAANMSDTNGECAHEEGAADTAWMLTQNMKPMLMAMHMLETTMQAARQLNKASWP